MRRRILLTQHRADALNRRRHRRPFASDRTEIGSRGRPASVAAAAAAAAAGNCDPAATQHGNVSNWLHFHLDTVAADFDRQVAWPIVVCGSYYECNVQYQK